MPTSSLAAVAVKRLGCSVQHVGGGAMAVRRKLQQWQLLCQSLFELHAQTFGDVAIHETNRSQPIAMYPIIGLGLELVVANFLTTRQQRGPSSLCGYYACPLIHLRPLGKQSFDFVVVFGGNHAYSIRPRLLDHYVEASQNAYTKCRIAADADSLVAGCKEFTSAAQRHVGIAVHADGAQR